MERALFDGLFGLRNEVAEIPTSVGTGSEGSLKILFDIPTAAFDLGTLSAQMHPAREWLPKDNGRRRESEATFNSSSDFIRSRDFGKGGAGKARNKSQ